MNSQECLDCGNALSLDGWCKECEKTDFKSNSSECVSGNPKIDECILRSKIDARELDPYFEFIPSESLDYVDEELGSRGTNFIALWMDGPKRKWDKESCTWLRYGPTKCVVKRIDESEDYLAKVLDYISKYLAKIPMAEVFGVTRDETGNLMIVTRFYKKGNLYKYLEKCKVDILWTHYLEELKTITQSLGNIHEQDNYHGNLCGGNIMIEDEGNFQDSFIIADIGLNRFSSKIFGSLPFTAPEVMKGNPYTPAADIYSFSMIMYLLSQGVPPFHQIDHNLELATLICNGHRPKISDNTPKPFAALMQKCWHNDPALRPKAQELSEIFGSWLNSLSDDCSEPFCAVDKLYVNHEGKRLEFDKATYTSQLLYFPSL
ncbi:4288_t:CDS:2, partial [Gigaspora margarita]